jgi:2-methylcitrate dehydratase PrpD
VIGGANAPGNLEFIKLVRDWGGKEEASILVHSSKVPAHNAAMVNGIMSRSFDFEPVSPTGDGMTAGGHISGSTVTTALTMGEAKDISGKDLITALLVGDDMATRVLLSETGSSFVLTSGWDHINTINTFGTTAIAGRILGLNKRQMKNAFGLALNQLSGTLLMIKDASTAFKMTQGLAAKNGIFSAEVAKAGWTSSEDALFNQLGYYELYTNGCQQPEILTKDLGKKYYSDGSIKPYPCCRANHGVIDCALALVKKHNIDAQDIQNVVIYLSPRYFGHLCAKPFRIGDFPHANAIWSFQYTVGTALLEKEVRPEHFTEESIRSPQINNFISKIELSEMTAEKKDSVKVKVIMKGGKEFTESGDVPKGDQIYNPMSLDDIIAKFWTNIEFSRTVTKENAKELLNLLENLEELDSVNRIMPLLVSR